MNLQGRAAARPQLSSALRPPELRARCCAPLQDGRLGSCHQKRERGILRMGGAQPVHCGRNGDASFLHSQRARRQLLQRCAMLTKQFAQGGTMTVLLVFAVAAHRQSGRV
jgi:hypothetical protein